jgi:hypothetical protein
MTKIKQIDTARLSLKKMEEKVNSRRNNPAEHDIKEIKNDFSSNVIFAFFEYFQMKVIRKINNVLYNNTPTIPFSTRTCKYELEILPVNVADSSLFSVELYFRAKLFVPIPLTGFSLNSVKPDFQILIRPKELLSCDSDEFNDSVSFIG